MPNRILRADILTSESVCTLKWDEEVFYRRLMSIVDDYGRHEANPQLLRSKCYPLQTDHVRVADISRWMAACQKAGLLLGYDVDGKAYLELQKFGQKRRTDSKCPSPPTSASKCQQMLANDSLGVCVVGGVVEGDISTPDGVEGDQPAADTLRKPPCPYEEILKLYHATLPTNPECRVLTPARKGQLRQRWLNELPTLDKWREFFEYVAQSDFLTGRAKPREGRKPFVAGLHWLTKQEKFALIAEGQYH